MPARVTAAPEYLGRLIPVCHRVSYGLSRALPRGCIIPIIRLNFREKNFRIKHCRRARRFPFSSASSEQTSRAEIMDQELTENSKNE